MWRFVFPFPDGRVFNRAVGGKDLQASFEQFKSLWTPNLGAVGVWRNQALVAKFLPVMDEATCELVPTLEEL